MLLVVGIIVVLFVGVVVSGADVVGRLFADDGDGVIPPWSKTLFSLEVISPYTKDKVIAIRTATTMLATNMK